LKKNVAKKEPTRPAVPNNRSRSAVGPRLAGSGRKPKPLSVVKSSKINHKVKNLSVHFPEGVVVTLKFCLITSLITSGAYNQQIYQLESVGLQLEKTKFKSEAISKIKKELQSVSIRHTS